MTITRQSLFDEISRWDASIAEYNEDKAGAFEAYREQLKAEGRSKADVAAEIAAWKKAYRRFRALDKDADAVLEQDALVDEIVAELKTGTNPATRVRRARPSEPAVHSSLVSPDTSSDGATRVRGKNLTRFSSRSAGAVSLSGLGGGEPVAFATSSSRGADPPGLGAGSPILSADVDSGRAPAGDGVSFLTRAPAGDKIEAAPPGVSGGVLGDAAMAGTSTLGHPENLEIPQSLRRDKNNRAPWMEKVDA